MDILNDPDMKEIVIEFCDEATVLFCELGDLLAVLEENPVDSVHMEQFGQTIDRIMGAAKSIGATEIGTFCELGKVIAYKASQTQEEALLTIVVAVLADATDLLSMMIEQLKTGNQNSLKTLNTKAFGTRLKWLSEKFKHIARASCSTTGSNNKEIDLNKESIDNLLASLGL